LLKQKSLLLAFPKLKSTGEYEVTDEKGVVRKVPTYEVKEQAALTPKKNLPNFTQSMSNLMRVVLI